jgi:hypothetical protein
MPPNIKNEKEMEENGILNIHSSPNKKEFKSIF